MPPLAEATDAAVARELQRHEAGKPDAGAVRALHVAGVPRGKCRVTHDPMPLHGHLDLVLGLGRFEQVCPERVGPDERRFERILVVLGVLGEQIGPGVAVEGLPGALVAIQEVGGGSVVHGHSSDPSRRSRPSAIR